MSPKAIIGASTTGWLVVMGRGAATTASVEAETPAGPSRGGEPSVFMG